MLALSAPISIVRRAKLPFAHGVMSPRSHSQHNSRAAIFGHQHPTIGNLTTPDRDITAHRPDVAASCVSPPTAPLAQAAHPRKTAVSLVQVVLSWLAVRGGI